jgi:hypothetical protein
METCPIYSWAFKVKVYNRTEQNRTAFVFGITVYEKESTGHTVYPEEKKKRGSRLSNISLGGKFFDGTLLY